MISQQESNTKIQTKRIHRRTKNQISGIYVCGDINCGKSYGTNAALYTHIKQKHNGIQPNGTTRPQTQLIRGRKGRPVADEETNIKIQSGQSCKICNQRQCKCIQKFDLQLIKLYSDDHFIQFIKQIGTLGQQNENNIWVRHVDADLANFNLQNLEQIKKQFIQKYQIYLKISPKLERFLLNTARFWQAQTIGQLYKSLLSCSHFKIDKNIFEFIVPKPFFKRFLEQIQKHKNSYQKLLILLKKIEN